MLKRNITYHISEDRLDRACYIMTTVGLGEMVKEVYGVDEKGRPFWKCVSDTGVISIYNGNRTRLITLYIATPGQITALYGGSPPSWLMKRAKKNKTHILAQNQA